MNPDQYPVLMGYSEPDHHDGLIHCIVGADRPGRERLSHMFWGHESSEDRLPDILIFAS